jgi:hypothetical protein
VLFALKFFARSVGQQPPSILCKVPHAAFEVTVRNDIDAGLSIETMKRSLHTHQLSNTLLYQFDNDMALACDFARRQLGHGNKASPVSRTLPDF